jgi:hypothetical protein
MKESGVNKSLVSIWSRVKNIYNESPVHAAFSYPFVFTFFLIVFAVIIEVSFEKLGFNPRNFVSYFLGTLFFLIPIWVLTGLFVSKKKIPFLLSIIIGSAIIYIPQFIQDGYANAARKAATKTLHAQTIKYISAEIQKCKTGESKFMSNSQDCPATATKAVMGAVNIMTDLNPFDTSKKAVREFNNNNDDKDVGFISLSVSGSSVVIRSCISKPCYDDKNRLQDSIEVQ